MTSVITFGGIGVILAVMGILVYLVAVVWPLFSGASLTPVAQYPLLSPSETAGIVYAGLDEYQALGLCVLRDGEVLTFDAGTGRILTREPLFPGDPPPVVSSVPAEAGHVAFGFPDGTVRLASVGFDSAFLGDSAASGGAGGGDGVVQRLASGESRQVTARIKIEEPIPVGAGGESVRLLDSRIGDNASILAALTGQGTLVVERVTSRTNLLTGEVSHAVSASRAGVPGDTADGDPVFLRVTSRGDQAYVVWEDGTALRLDLRDTDHPVVAERVDLTPEPGVTVTAMRFVSGDQSLLVSDSGGATHAWFPAERPGTEDGRQLVAAHTLQAHPAPVDSIAVSTRDKTLATGADDGGIFLQHLTSDRTLAVTALTTATAVRALQITPKGDGLFAVGADGEARRWSVRNPHPETSLASLFGKVWYEGYPTPTYTWQSSSGTDDFEPKLSLIPLIFGTLKATIYSMLFAVPIALFAAIYTSEFLDPRLRAPIKSTIEMMASLPSVVLGFIAALVLAPVVESWVIAVLLVFGVAPLSALAAGYLWQMLPQPLVARLAGRVQFLLLILVVSLSVFVAAELASPIEGLMFHGNFKAWLDGRVGTGAPGIGMLAWPFIVVALLIADRRYFADRIHRWLPPMPPRRESAFDFAKFVALLTLSVAVSWAIAVTGSALGFDPRGHVLGTYVQRNALVVGFVMGFAVIPIIYTIADDALAAVPRTLRSASLGCGATRWQTATRVVLPVAISGIFSALMVGLGRAVGETMIVLMAAGNTPLMDMNLFNGLRTLSANIAVELPEAVKDGTLYRVLFLSALLLFFVTFIVNTLAEIVRQRFRKKAYQL